MKTKESQTKDKKVTLKDLPAKRLSREQEAKVKGGGLKLNHNETLVRDAERKTK